MVVGLGTVPLGLGTVPLGLGTAPLGLGTALLGLGKALPGLGTALLGLGTVLLGLGRHATRIRAQFLIIRVWVRLCSIFIYVTFENKKSIASKHLWYSGRAWALQTWMSVFKHCLCKCFFLRFLYLFGVTIFSKFF